jgi:hypothetical protein
MLQNQYPLYIKICQNIKNNYNYPWQIFLFVYFFFVEPYIKYYNTTDIPKRFIKYLKYILLHLPKIIFVLLLLIDCIFNNYKIHYIFYYLPFYFIFHLWDISADFLVKTDNQTNKIIYERYYEEDNVKYINTTNEEDNFLYEYIERGCKCFSHFIKEKDINLKIEKIEMVFLFSRSIIYNRRFIRKDHKTFINISTGEEVYKENIGEIYIKISDIL